MLGVAFIITAVVAGVIFYIRSDSGVTGQADTERPGPTGPAPDLTGYQPPSGCVIDGIFEKDGWVWSEFLNAPIRPVVQELDDGEVDEFPVKYYPDALNCSRAAELVNPYRAPEPTDCEAESLTARDGWIEGECRGRVRPDIPVIIGGEDGMFIIQGPLGEHGFILGDPAPYEVD
jgi:hypothetical protein